MKPLAFSRRSNSTERRTSRYVFALALALATAACSGDDHAPPPPADTIPSSGGSTGRGGTASVFDAGAGGRASDSGSVSDASTGGTSHTTPDASSTDAAVVVDAGCKHPMPGALPGSGKFACSPATMWSTGSPLRSASTDSDDVFSAITPDELTIVWMSIAGGTPMLNYTDRAHATDAFDPFSSVPLTSDYYAAERAAVSPDGARVIVLRKDRKGFAEFVRQGRFYKFDDPAPSEAQFAAINNQGLILETNEFFGDPILASDDRTFYYSKYGAGETATVFAAVRTADVPWPLGTPVDGPPLLDDCGARRRPTGVSADGLTLFYFDETSNSERATWRASVDSAFSGFVDLGARAEAQPNSGCTVLYFSGRASDAASGTDDLVATSE